MVGLGLYMCVWVGRARAVHGRARAVHGRARAVHVCVGR